MFSVFKKNNLQKKMILLYVVYNDNNVNVKQFLNGFQRGTAGWTEIRSTVSLAS